MKEIYSTGQCVLGTIGFRLSSRASTFKMAVQGSQVLRPSRKKLNL